MTTVLTYGTFDLLHIGHLNLLERLAERGDRLVVGVSSDEFNSSKGKKSLFNYQERSRLLGALSCVDEVFPEHSWEQKLDDIKHYQANVFGMGSDWQGKFDHLKPHCEVIYLPRTQNVSSTDLKRSLSQLDRKTVRKLKQGMDSLLDIIKAIE